MTLSVFLYHGISSMISMCGQGTKLKIQRLNHSKSIIKLYLLLSPSLFLGGSSLRDVDLDVVVEGGLTHPTLVGGQDLGQLVGDG